MADDKRRHAARPSHAAPPAHGGRHASAPAGGERISTLRSGQGARVTTRKNAAEAAGRARKNAERRYFERHPEARAAAAGPARSGRNVVLLVIMAILALAIVFVVGSCVTGMLSGSDDQGQDRPTQTLKLTEQEQQALDQRQAHDAGQEQVDVGGTLSYGGETFALAQQDDGSWALVRTDSSGASQVLFLLEGTPVALARTSDTILIPENRGEGWDVVCYVVHGQGSASYLVDEGGSVAGGEGEAASAELEGTSILVTDSSGETHEISLV